MGGTAGSSELAKQQAQDLIDDLISLRTMLNSIADKGIELHSDTGWEGAKRTSFATTWGDEGDRAGEGEVIEGLENGGTVTGVLTSNGNALVQVAEQAGGSVDFISAADTGEADGIA